MIRYALACKNGHDFESWFPSASSFDAQTERGLVGCPFCGSAEVSKQPMAPSIGKGSRKAGPAETGPRAEPGEVALPAAAPPPQPVAVLSEREAALRAMVRAVREHVTKTADYVGPGFADEARRMHYGEAPQRSIYGETDPGEAKALLEEGIAVHPLPVAPDDRN